MFRTPHVELFNRDPPDRGGASNTVPSLKRNTNFYVEENTGEGRESSPPIYKTDNRGK